jgi:hypothetical protein
MSWQLTVGGKTEDIIYSVQHRRTDEGRLGSATVEVVNNTTNRSIEPGTGAQLTRPDGTTVFDGVVASQPTQSQRDFALTLELTDRRILLQNEPVNRVWYETDTGQMIRDAVGKRAEPQTRNLLFDGSSTTDWTASGTDDFRLAELNNLQLNEYGSNALFIGMSEGSSGSFSVKYTGVDTTLVKHNTLLKFDSRLTVNNLGQFFSCTVELTDDSSNSYLWDVDLLPAVATETYELEVEDAKSDGAQLSNPGNIEYRFTIKGDLPEPRGIVIDHARTQQVRLEDRQTNITTNNVAGTQRTTTRRFNGSVGKMIQALGKEDEFRSYIDSSDDLHYVPRDDTQANLRIDDASTLVTGYDINRDYQAVKNRTVVQGRGEIQVTAEDNASQDKHSLGAQTQRVTDKGITNVDDAIKRAEGEQESWDNGLIKWTIGDSDYNDLTVGDEIDVKWSPEDIDATHRVKSVGADADGFVEVETVGYIG